MRTPSLARLAIIGLVLLLVPSLIPSTGSLSAQSGEKMRTLEARVNWNVMKGDDAARFIAARQASEPQFRQAWAKGRNLRRARNSSNLTVIQLRPNRQPPIRKALLARFVDSVLGSGVVHASGYDDCDEFLPIAYAPGRSMTAVTRIALRFTCGDIEEANYYSDAFEGNVNEAGSLAVYVASEMIGPNTYGYVETTVEIATDVTDVGGTASVSSAAGDWRFWLWFSDPGSGATDMYRDSGIPCDQFDDIRGWMKSHAWDAANSAVTILAGAIGGAATCSTNPITIWTVSVCAAVGATISYLLAWDTAYGLYHGEYLLDCYFDIMSPAPTSGMRRMPPLLRSRQIRM